MLAVEDRGRRCRLVVFGLEVGGRWDAEAPPTARVRPCLWHAACAPPSFAGSLVEWPRRCCCAKGACSLQPRSSSCRCTLSPVLPDQPQLCTNSCPLDQRASAEPRPGPPVEAE